MKKVNIYLILYVVNAFFTEGYETYQEMSEQFVSGQGAVFVRWDGDSGAATCNRPNAHSLPVRTIALTLH